MPYDFIMDIEAVVSLLHAGFMSCIYYVVLMCSSQQLVKQCIVFFSYLPAHIFIQFTL